MLKLPPSDTPDPARGGEIAGILRTTGPSGVIVVDGSNCPIGAVGISGDTSDNDEICALAGIAAAGLKVQG